ncbi:MAG: ComF family protein [Bacillota bacterium]|nr:MAG: ComF family protein [Bacillota bacterium]
MRELGRALMDVLLPEGGCAICGGSLPSGDPPPFGPSSLAWEPEVCPRCLDEVFTQRPRPSPLSAEVAVHLDGVVTAGSYAGALQSAVLRLKAAPDLRLARFLGRLLAESLQAPGLPAGWGGIVPVPLHRSRLLERGFNQAALLAAELGGALGSPVLSDLCERVRATPLQSGCTREERARNVANCFRLRRVGLLGTRPLTFVIVDDVVTTGATAGELARVLKAGGAEVVWCAAVARAGSMM